MLSRLFQVFIAGMAANGIHAADTCNLRTSTMDFGTYDAFGSQRAVSEVELNNCPAHARVKLSAGLHAGGDVGRRTMRGSEGGAVRYNLYRDSSAQTPWGREQWDGWFTGGQNAAVMGSRRILVYGEIPKGQFAPSGHYHDQIMITVEW